MAIAVDVTWSADIPEAELAEMGEIKVGEGPTSRAARR